MRLKSLLASTYLLELIIDKVPHDLASHDKEDNAST